MAAVQITAGSKFKRGNFRRITALTPQDNLELTVKRIENKHEAFLCCDDHCLMFGPDGKKSLDNLSQNIRICQEKLLYRSNDERKRIVFDVLKWGYKGVGDKGSAKNLEYRIVPGGPIVCRQAFVTAYDLSDHVLRELTGNLKQNEERPAVRSAPADPVLSNISYDYITVFNATMNGWFKIPLTERAAKGSHSYS